MNFNELMRLRRVVLLTACLQLSSCTTVREAIEESARINRDVQDASQNAFAGPRPGKIVNGVDVAPNDPKSKLAVMLLITSGSRLSTCTGVLVKPKVVLTAAHCVAEVEPKQVRVVFNTSLAPGNPEARASVLADKIERHPDFDGKPENQSDLALLRLFSEAPKEYEIASFLKHGTKPSTDEVVLLGYGITGEKKQDSMTLRTTTKNYKKDLHLKKTTVGIDQSGDTGGFCRGDSGAPLFVSVDKTLKLIGINSYTVGLIENRECHTASVAMLIPHFEKWILTRAAQL